MPNIWNLKIVLNFFSDDYEYYQTQSQLINTVCIKVPGSFNLQGIHKIDPSWGLCRMRATTQPHSHQQRIPETGYGILRNSWFSLRSLAHSLPHTTNKYIQCCWSQTLVLEMMNWTVALFKFLLEKIPLLHIYHLNYHSWTFGWLIFDWIHYMRLFDRQAPVLFALRISTLF